MSSRRAPLLLPDGSPMPLPYRWLYANRLLEWRPWHFVEQQQSALGLRQEFLKEVASPNTSRVRDCLPFASHQAHDDYAAYVLHEGKATGEVCLVHLTWSGRAEAPGFPSLTVYRDTWEWLRECVVPEVAEWAKDNPEDIDDLLAEEEEAAKGK